MGEKINYAEEIAKLARRIKDQRTLKRIWKLLDRAYSNFA